MSGYSKVSAVLVFVLALAINCIQASQVTFDQISSNDPIVNASKLPIDASDSVLAIANDDNSADIFIVPSYTISLTTFNPVLAPLVLHPTHVKPVKFPQHSVLRI